MASQKDSQLISSRTPSLTLMLLWGGIAISAKRRESKLEVHISLHPIVTCFEMLFLPTLFWFFLLFFCCLMPRWIFQHVLYNFTNDTRYKMCHTTFAKDIFSWWMCPWDAAFCARVACLCWILLVQRIEGEGFFWCFTLVFYIFFYFCVRDTKANATSKVKFAKPLNALFVVVFFFIRLRCWLTPALGNAFIRA